LATPGSWSLRIGTVSDGFSHVCFSRWSDGCFFFYIRRIHGDRWLCPRLALSWQELAAGLAVFILYNDAANTTPEPASLEITPGEIWFARRHAHFESGRLTGTSAMPDKKTSLANPTAKLENSKQTMKPTFSLTGMRLICSI
jgi:hypothetical protein